LKKQKALANFITKAFDAGSFLQVNFFTSFYGLNKLSR